MILLVFTKLDQTYQIYSYFVAKVYLSANKYILDAIFTQKVTQHLISKVETSARLIFSITITNLAYDQYFYNFNQNTIEMSWLFLSFLFTVNLHFRTMLSACVIYQYC